MSTLVHWTEEMRAKVVPRRGHGRASATDSMPRAKVIAEVHQAAGEKPGAGSDANTMTYRWAVLRRALVAASQADYDAALEAARAFWPKNADLLPRAAIAFAFPDEGDWATTTTAAMLDQIKKQKGKIAPYEAGLGLLGAVASADLQTALAKAAAAKRVALYALTEQIPTMIDLTGEQAAAGIAALLATAPSNEHKRDYSEALAMIETEEAGRALASAMSSKVVLPIAKSYFERYPAIARVVLPTIAKGSTTSAPIAAQLLKGS